MAFAGYMLLPNYPSNTAFLSPEETDMAQWRLNCENDGGKDEVSESVFVGLKQAISDPKVVLTLHPRVTGANTTRPATPCLHPNLGRGLHVLHILLPLHRANPRLPTRTNPAPHMPALLPCLPLFVVEFLALRSRGRTLLPHRHSMHDLRCGADPEYVDAQHWREILYNVSAGDGKF